MKLHILFTLAFVLICPMAWLQPTTGFNYQAVVRDNNEILADEPVSIRFIIHRDADYGPVSYQELHSDEKTNAYGLLNLRVGGGDAEYGVFDTITWGASAYFLEVELKKNGAGNFTAIGEPSEIIHAPQVLPAEGHFVGMAPVFGFNEGAVHIQGSDWQVVTRTQYGGLEYMFPQPVHPGSVRQYYLFIRKADGITDCAEGSLWRFWFSWDNQPGHEFTVERNWGALDEGSYHIVETLPTLTQTPGGTHYWRLEARIPENCAGAAMRVFGIYAMAVDVPGGHNPPLNLNTDFAPGTQAKYLLGGNGGGIEFSPDPNSTLIHGRVHIDLSGESGPGGRDGLFIIGAGQEGSVTILANKESINFWNYAIDNWANIGAKSVSTHGPVWIDLSAESGSGGRDALFLNGSGGQEGSVTILANKETINFWNYSADYWANISCRQISTHGDAFIDGTTTTKVLVIQGGGDITEKVNSVEALEAGEVVVIDPSNSNHVFRCTQAYDKRVFGVVSGAGGIRSGLELQQDEVLEGDIPIAIAGRVKVKIIGKVEPGDLLTSSKAPGHAMKAKKFRKQNGAVIGKALSYPDEEGLVLMLVLPR